MKDLQKFIIEFFNEQFKTSNPNDLLWLYQLKQVSSLKSLSTVEDVYDISLEKAVYNKAQKMYSDNQSKKKQTKSRALKKSLLRKTSNISN